MRISRRPRTTIPAVLIVVTVVATPLRGSAQPANPQPATNPAAKSAEAGRPSLAPLAPVFTKALEGDVREALRILQTVPLDTLNSRELALRENLLKTFVNKQLPPH